VQVSQHGQHWMKHLNKEKHEKLIGAGQEVRCEHGVPRRDGRLHHVGRRAWALEGGASLETKKTSKKDTRTQKKTCQ
jgi:hypothetical protein